MQNNTMDHKQHMLSPFHIRKANRNSNRESRFNLQISNSADGGGKIRNDRKLFRHKDIPLFKLGPDANTKKKTDCIVKQLLQPSKVDHSFNEPTGTSFSNFEVLKNCYNTSTQQLPLYQKELLEKRNISENFSNSNLNTTRNMFNCFTSEKFKPVREYVPTSKEARFVEKVTDQTRMNLLNLSGNSRLQKNCSNISRDSYKSKDWDFISNQIFKSAEDVKLNNVRNKEINLENKQQLESNNCFSKCSSKENNSLNANLVFDCNEPSQVIITENNHSNTKCTDERALKDDNVGNTPKKSQDFQEANKLHTILSPEVNSTSTSTAIINLSRSDDKKMTLSVPKKVSALNGDNLTSVKTPQSDMLLTRHQQYFKTASISKYNIQAQSLNISASQNNYKPINPQNTQTLNLPHKTAPSTDTHYFVKKVNEIHQNILTHNKSDETPVKASNVTSNPQKKSHTNYSIASLLDLSKNISHEMQSKDENFLPANFCQYCNSVACQKKIYKPKISSTPSTLSSKKFNDPNHIHSTHVIIESENDRNIRENDDARKPINNNTSKSKEISQIENSQLSVQLDQCGQTSTDSDSRLSAKIKDNCIKKCNNSNLETNKHVTEKSSPKINDDIETIQHSIENLKNEINELKNIAEHKNETRKLQNSANCTVQKTTLRDENITKIGDSRLMISSNGVHINLGDNILKNYDTYLTFCPKSNTSKIPDSTLLSELCKSIQYAIHNNTNLTKQSLSKLLVMSLAHLKKKISSDSLPNSKLNKIDDKIEHNKNHISEDCSKKLEDSFSKDKKHLNSKSTNETIHTKSFQEIPKKLKANRTFARLNRSKLSTSKPRVSNVLVKVKGISKMQRNNFLLLNTTLNNNKLIFSNKKQMYVKKRDENITLLAKIYRKKKLKKALAQCRLKKNKETKTNNNILAKVPVQKQTHTVSQILSDKVSKTDVSAKTESIVSSQETVQTEQKSTPKITKLMTNNQFQNSSDNSYQSRLTTSNQYYRSHVPSNVNSNSNSQNADLQVLNNYYNHQQSATTAAAHSNNMLKASKNVQFNTQTRTSTAPNTCTCNLANCRRCSSKQQKNIFTSSNTQIYIVNAEDYLKELRFLQVNKCPREFFEFYYYLTRKQIYYNTYPMSFKYFMDLFNRGYLEKEKNYFSTVTKNNRVITDVNTFL